jgi:ACT domain-containing protein
MVMRFGTLNVRSLYRAGSLRTVAEEVSKYKLDLLGVQRSDGAEVALNQQANINFSMERGMIIMN